uniref:Uncharacterized protein n=1 Tax=Leersia perrieri TaxID=77586 RepID=A0A0D9WUZ3_9ORYZ
MAMALGRLSRRLSASQAAGVTRRIGVPEMMTKTTIPQSPPPLPSLLPASPWISLPGPAAQLMGRAFSSPVAASAAARVRRRIPNLQGHQHLRVICRGTDGCQSRSFYHGWINRLIHMNIQMIALSMIQIIEVLNMDAKTHLPVLGIVRWLFSTLCYW